MQRKCSGVERMQALRVRRFGERETGVVKWGLIRMLKSYHIESHTVLIIVMVWSSSAWVYYIVYK